jgi:hypothetical protein
MSVLKLRRDMVVADDEPPASKAGETDRPFPLRKLDAELEPEDVVEGTLVDDEPEADDETGAQPHRAHKTLGQHIRFWANTVAIVALLGAYPTLVIASSDVGDRDFDRLVNRADWAAPWVGGVASLMEDHFNQLGWAPDAAPWDPMARLTAKPAYQAAMVEALGDVIRAADARATAIGQPDTDLAAAARLVNEASTAIQLRAARDALVNHDRRLRRQDAVTDLTAAQVAEQLGLLSSWAAASQSAIVTSATAIGGSPMDEEATRAVYAAKGRATVAWLVLASMQWPASAEAAKARDAAMNAWREVAEFHPLIVFNGDADGSLFGNHAASMSFLIAQAEAATTSLRALANTAAAVPAPVPAPASGAAP